MSDEKRLCLPADLTRVQMISYITDSLEDLPEDILRLIYRIVLFSLSGLE